MELKSRGQECLANHFRRSRNNHTDLQPNRRLRDRMSGGVRGRGLATLSYSFIMVLTLFVTYDIITITTA